MSCKTKHAARRSKTDRKRVRTAPAGSLESSPASSKPICDRRRVIVPNRVGIAAHVRRVRCFPLLEDATALSQSAVADTAARSCQTTASGYRGSWRESSKLAIIESGIIPIA